MTATCPPCTCLRPAWASCLVLPATSHLYLMAPAGRSHQAKHLGLVEVSKHLPQWLVRNTGPRLFPAGNPSWSVDWAHVKIVYGRSDTWSHTQRPNAEQGFQSFFRPTGTQPSVLYLPPSQQGHGQKQNTSAQWPCYSWIPDLFFLPPLWKHTGSWTRIMHYNQNRGP